MSGALRDAHLIRIKAAMQHIHYADSTANRGDRLNANSGQIRNY
jgi:hypothetical protein